MFTASEISRALGLTKKTIHRKALAEQWPVTRVANRYTYDPPAEIAAQLVPDLLGTSGYKLADGRAPVNSSVTFADVAQRPAQSAKVRAREAAVLFYQDSVALGAEAALRATVSQFVADLPISVRSLRRWVVAYGSRGLDGLVEQKLGASGRKGVEIPDDLRRYAQAKNVGHGSIARAARVLMTHPELPAAAREHLHEAHASKSYVTPSIRRALEVPALVQDRLTGPKAARLAGRFTPQDWSMVRPNDIWCSDDMTGNGVCWTETPHAPGWRMGQPQVLPVLDCGTLRWLNVHVILRESGQYTSDDIFGLFGDTFDLFGLPTQIILEGGHWQSKNVIGHRTNIHEEDRIGGLASLGVETVRSWDPRNKPIEQAFNQLQCAMDDCPGYTGRDARRETPEVTAKRLALCRSGKHHPREFFPHISQLADHIRTTMENLNHERQDGKVLRGRSPLEAWAEANVTPRAIPDESRWLYRSAMSICLVTRNGVRVTQGSGRNMMVYYYDAPELLIPRQGRKVVCYWNGHNPDADAIIVDLFEGNRRKFAGVAKRVKDLARFGASQEDIEAEKARKKAANLYVRSEYRAIQPELQRTHCPAEVPADAETGAAVAAAARAQEEEATAKRDSDRDVRQTRVSHEDLEAATGVSPRGDHQRGESGFGGGDDDIATVIAALYPGQQGTEGTERTKETADENCPF